MELYNTYRNEFRKMALDILENNEYLLVLVQYCAGKRDFILFKSIKLFDKFIKERKSNELITLFKNIDIHLQGIVDDDFVSQLKTIINRNNYPFWTVVEFNNNLDFSWNDIDVNSDGEIDKAFLEEFEGEFVVIFPEPDWRIEINVFHGYISDKDGIVRPGKAY